MTYEEKKQYGHIIEDKDEYWLEIKTGNKLSKSIISDIDRVPTYFKDNMSCCEDCTDCKDCTSCNGCDNSEGCCNCILCSNCKGCDDCIRCHNLNHKKNRRKEIGKTK